MKRRWATDEGNPSLIYRIVCALLEWYNRRHNIDYMSISFVNDMWLVRAKQDEKVLTDEHTVIIQQDESLFLNP